MAKIAAGAVRGQRGPRQGRGRGQKSRVFEENRVRTAAPNPRGARDGKRRGGSACCGLARQLGHRRRHPGHPCGPAPRYSGDARSSQKRSNTLSNCRNGILVHTGSRWPGHSWIHPGDTRHASHAARHARFLRSAALHASSSSFPTKRHWRHRDSSNSSGAPSYARPRTNRPLPRCRSTSDRDGCSSPSDPRRWSKYPRHGPPDPGSSWNTGRLSRCHPSWGKFRAQKFQRQRGPSNAGEDFSPKNAKHSDFRARPYPV
mmetsp:Transcript_61729/g.130279  ORF Transcript_61729/g.130279 Transcript_61729/m.130279 type:complete len:259 (+) Transcript_61729:1262-2038(+)